MALRDRLAVVTLAMALCLPAAAQQPAPARPAFKGIWEPVSFTEDISLREVFFVTIDKGWVAGDKGTILHTKDGGASWTAQLGGDPQAAEEPVRLLRFLDETHGWAVIGGTGSSNARILRTEDGESWEDLGKAPQYIHELAMSSPTEGVAAGFLGMGSVPSTLLKTRDGGKTWQPVVGCSVKATVGGLNREIGCNISRIQFVTPSVGYLVAKTKCVGPCENPSILAKTEDGGESWRFFVGPGNPDEVGATDLFFTSETTGVVSTTDGKLSRTTDGGETWKGLLASVSPYARGGLLRFADPEVGWALYGEKMSFTTDGGTRWNSREIRFLTTPRAWSFPRRDRAYVVGDHGMVFRYRVVPQAEPVKAGVLVAPAMPAFASPLDDQAKQVTAILTELGSAVTKAPDQAAGAAAAAPVDRSAPPPSAEGVVAEPPSAFIAGCCGPSVNKLNLVISALAKSLPSFLAQYKNTNLLAVGVRMLTDLPGKFGDLRAALLSFKHAGDKDAAQAALGAIGTAAQALHRSAKVAFQQELPPPGTGGEAAPDETQAAAAASVVADPARSLADSTALQLKKEAQEEQAKKGMGGLLKKQVRIP